MTTFDRVLSRADSDVLSSMLGAATVKLLVALDRSNDSPAALRQLLLQLRQPTDLLSDSDCRAQLVDLLRQDEAIELLERLGLKQVGCPWAMLRAARWNSKAQGLWLAFFGLPALQPADLSLAAPIDSISPTYGLFRHQRTALESVWRALARRKSRILLHLPTGAGKTRIAMHLIVRHLVQTEPTIAFWLANSEELCTQASEEFERAWSQLGNRPVNLYRMWGGRRVDPSQLSDGFFVGSLASAYSRHMETSTWAAFTGDKTTLVVMDEAHQAIAPTYQFLLEALLARRQDQTLVGLTATPGRTWNDPVKDAELADFFQRTKVTLSVPGYDSPLDYLISEGYLAHPTFHRVEYPSRPFTAEEVRSLAHELDVPASILQRLADDEIRSVKIVLTVEDLARRHLRILVFATTADHAERLAPVLTARGIPARCVTAQTHSYSRRAAIEWYKAQSPDVRVLTNFGVLTTGFDAPRTSAALIARPTKSLVLFSQMVGRAIRGPLAGGNSAAEIVSVVDTSLKGFDCISAAFENWEDVW